MIKIDIPRTSERIRGITLPNDGVMYVADYDEVFKITLNDKPKVEILDDDPYEFLGSQKHFLGVNNHTPILKSNGNKISYTFWQPAEYGTFKHKLMNVFGLNKDYITVKYLISNKSGEIKFRALSGDWFAASFSMCGKYLVIAEPYDFEVYKIA